MEAESGVAFPHLRTLHRPVTDTATPTEQGHGHGHEHGPPPAATSTAPAPLLDGGLDAGFESSLQELAAVHASSRPLSLQELRHHTVRSE
eukprot:scaffold67372_cov62-Phaeocystis_antarctica.AAC.3